MRKGPFLLRRLHALTGVVPLSLFFVEHLWTNAAALAGRAAFDGAVAQIQALPMLWAVELFGIFLPLAFHAGYGFVIIARGRPNVDAYAYGRNWAYVLQRVSGVVLFAFLAAHLWELWAQRARGTLDSGDFYDTLVAHLGGQWAGIPVRAALYLVGLAAAAFHFGNGLVGFSQSFGLVTTRAAQRRVTWAAGALATALFALGVATVFHLAAGFPFGLTS